MWRRGKVSTFLCKLCSGIFWKEDDHGGECIYCMAELGNPDALKLALSKGREYAIRDVQESEAAAGEDL